MNLLSLTTILGGIKIIIISKEEAEVVRKRLPKTGISVTSKNKRSRGKTYYMEENAASMRLICELRKIPYAPKKYFY